jgi:hypothetical protein
MIQMDHIQHQLFDLVLYQWKIMEGEEVFDSYRSLQIRQLIFSQNVTVFVMQMLQPLLSMDQIFEDMRLLGKGFLLQILPLLTRSVSIESLQVQVKGGYCISRRLLVICFVDNLTLKPMQQIILMDQLWCNRVQKISIKFLMQMV